MGANVTIDIDQHTARLLEVRAAELGVTVPELIAELAALESTPRVAVTAAIVRRYDEAHPTGGVPEALNLAQPPDELVPTRDNAGLPAFARSAVLNWQPGR